MYEGDGICIKEAGKVAKIDVRVSQRKLIKPERRKLRQTNLKPILDPSVTDSQFMPPSQLKTSRLPQPVRSELVVHNYAIEPLKVTDPYTCFKNDPLNMQMASVGPSAAKTTCKMLNHMKVVP